MCRNIKIELTYLKVRLSLRLVRSLRTIRGRFRRFPVGVVPPLRPMQTDTTSANNFQHCWVLLANNVASVFTGLKV